MRPMSRRVAFTATAILLTLVLAPLGAGGQAPPGPTTRHQFRTAGLPAPGPMELLKFVLEFPPGAATPPHTHPGLVVATVLEGETTFETQGGEKVYRVGDTLIELPNEVGVARNSAPGRTRVMGTNLIPKGAAPSTPQPGAPIPPVTPTALYQYRIDAVIPAGPYEVAHAVLDFAPGAQTPPHTHPGQTAVTVLEGAQTIRSGGTERVYQAGESFFEPADTVVQAVNMTAGRTTVLVTYLLPQGAPLSTPVQAMPGLPATGVGGATRWPMVWLALLAGGAILATGWSIRRAGRVR